MSFWGVAQTVSRRERFVADRVIEEGFETFTPRVRVRINGQWRVVALFQGYLFVRIINQWRVITKVVGVLGLVMNGEQPGRCPDVEVEKIKAATMRNGLVRLPKPPPRPMPLKVGERIRIVSGSFRGFEAIYEGMTAHEREVVLLDMFGRETRIELSSDDQLAPLAQQAGLIY
jgi:transcriptional antiterminator RfaH